MVVKLNPLFYNVTYQFENGVISYGGQTILTEVVVGELFENGVISYGGQTKFLQLRWDVKFENGVISYGGQAITFNVCFKILVSNFIAVNILKNTSKAKSYTSIIFSEFSIQTKAAFKIY